MTSTAEYDAFGPWIDEVRAPEEVPRLFRGHGVDLDAAQLVLKVPRNVSRRDATPDMDLYDHLLVLTPDELMVLSRLGAAPEAGEPSASVRDQALGYRTWSARRSEVVALRDVTSLLDARLDVLTTDGRALAVPYNGSASEGVQRLVDALRAQPDAARPEPDSGVAPVSLVKPATPERPGGYGPASLRGRAPVRPADPVLAPSALGPEDVGLVNAYRELARRLPELRLLALHPRRRVRPARPDPIEHALHAVSPATLHGAVLAQDDRWIEVLGRRAWLTRGRAPDHSRARLTIARSAVRQVHAVPHPRYGGVTQVTLTLVVGGPGVEVAAPSGSDAEQVLLTYARA